MNENKILVEDEIMRRKEKNLDFFSLLFKKVKSEFLAEGVAFYG